MITISQGLRGLAVVAFCVSAALAQQPGGEDGGRRSRGGGFPGFGGGGFTRFEPDSFLTQMRFRRDLSDDLGLSESQREQLSELRREMDTKRGELFQSGGGFQPGQPPSEEMMKKMSDMRQEFDKKAVATLNKDQVAKWEVKKAEYIKEAAEREAQRQQEGDRRGPPGVGSSPQSTQRRPQFVQEPPPEGAEVIASFTVEPRAAAAAAVGEIAASIGGNGANTTTERATTGATTTERSVASAAGASSGMSALSGPEPLMQFQFQHAPWPQVLKMFAETAGLTLDLSDPPPGTFNYFDDHKYTVTEALDIINGYLLPRGYVLVRRDRFLVSLNIDNDIPPNLIPRISLSELPHRGKNELVAVVLPLQGVDANQVDDEVRETMLGPQGKVAAMRNSNSLFVSDLAANVRTVVETLREVVPKLETDFKAIPLKYISAADAERTVRRLFGLNATTSLSSTTPQFGGGFPGGFPGGGFPGSFGGGFPGGYGGFPGGFSRDGDRGSSSSDRDRDRSSSGDSGRSSSSSSRSGGIGGTQSPYAGKIMLTADTRTNVLYVTASSQLLRVVEDVIRAMDTDVGTDKTDSPLVLRVYNVSGGDANSIATTLSMIKPGLLMIPDPRSARLHVEATEEEHREIQKLIQQFTGDATSSVAVIPLQRLDPVAATNTIRNLFINDAARAPTIEADSAGRRLMVRGTPDQVVQVKALLAQLGETGETGSAGNGRRGNVRTLPLGGRDPEEFLKYVRDAWSTTGSNPIRIVVPSQPNPIRERSVPSQNSGGFGEPQPSSQLPNRVPGVPSTQRQVNSAASTTLTNASQEPAWSGSPITVEAVDDLGVLILSGPEDHLSKIPATTPASRPRPFVTKSTTRNARSNPSAAVEPRRETIMPIATPRVVTLRSESQPAMPAVVATRDATDAEFDAFLKSFLEPVESASVAEVAVDADAASEEAEADAEADEPEAAQPAEQEDKAADALNPDVPIGVTIVGGDIVITSSNEAALDQFESLVEQLATVIPARARWTVFYLRTADATETAQMLERLFPQSTVTASTASSDGFLGSFSSGISSFGRGMMNATGLSGATLGGQNLRIITDTRQNALFVTGPSDKIAEVEQMLQLLDSSDLPQSLRDRLPRSIPVRYADVDEVCEMIESLFKDAINPEPVNVGGRGGINPLAMLMGQGGGGGQAKQRGPELTLGVDRRTSNLIVSCNDSLYRQIEDLVQTIDNRARDARQTVKVVPLASADPMLVSTTLTSLIPKVSVSSTRGRSSSVSRSQTGQPGTRSSSGSSGGGDSSRSSSAPDADAIRRMMEFRSQSGGGDRGGSSSGFGGDRGGSSRSFFGGFGGGDRGGSSGDRGR